MAASEAFSLLNFLKKISLFGSLFLRETFNCILADSFVLPEKHLLLCSDIYGRHLVNRNAIQQENSKLEYIGREY